MHGNPRAVGHDLNNLIRIGGRAVDPRPGCRDHRQVTSMLPVLRHYRAGLPPGRPRQQRQFRRCHRATPVVVRMYREQDAVPTAGRGWQSTHLIRKQIVEDSTVDGRRYTAMLRRGLPYIQHRVAHLHGKNPSRCR